MLLEDIGYSVDHLSSDGHLVRVEVASALGRLNLEFDLGGLFLFDVLLLVLVLLDEAEGVLGFEEEGDFLFGGFEHGRLGFEGGVEGVLAAEERVHFLSAHESFQQKIISVCPQKKHNKYAFSFTSL